MKKILLFSSFSLAAAMTTISAQVVLADFQFTGDSLSSPEGVPADDWFTSDLGTGGGVPLNFIGSEGSPASPAIIFEMGDVNDSTFIDNDYYTFTITPDAGQQIDFTSFTFDFQKASGGANVEWQVRSEVDAFAASIGNGSVSPQGSWVTGNSATVTGLGSQSTGTEFRIYFFTTGSFAPNQLYLDNIVIEGNVSPVPEPSSFALLAGMFGLTWVMLRRR